MFIFSKDHFSTSKCYICRYYFKDFFFFTHSLINYSKDVWKPNIDIYTWLNNIYTPNRHDKVETFTLGHLQYLHWLFVYYEDSVKLIRQYAK